MILGFLGKGGSGKSTLSTVMVEYLHHYNKTVLALDADYNMDLSYNLGVSDNVEYIGNGAKKDLKEYIDVEQHKAYSDIVLEKNDAQFFTLSPVDSFTKKYTKEIRKNLHVMCVGPQSHDVLSDKMCSHGLGALLKAYLPLLVLEDDQYVVVDEKAGADGVSGGICTGFDLAIVVVEPTAHGVKAGKQIAEILQHFKTPYVFVLNKVKKDTHIEEIETTLGAKVAAVIPFGESVDLVAVQGLFEYIQNMSDTNTGGTRLERSKNKFLYNKENILVK